MVKWSTIKIVAIKPHTYGTRHLTAGEEYELRSEEAIAQVALRNADFAKPSKPKPAVVEPAVAHVEEQAPAADELAQHHQPEPEPEHKEPEHSNNLIGRLRAEALNLGIEVDGRWGVARLQHEISQAKRRCRSPKASSVRPARTRHLSGRQCAPRIDAHSAFQTSFKCL